MPGRLAIISSFFKKLSASFFRPLRRYESADYLLYRKSRLLYTLLFAMFVFLIVFFFWGLATSNLPSPINILPYALSFAVLSSSWLLLVKKRYSIASAVVLVTIAFTLWITMFLAPEKELLANLDTFSVLLALLTLSSLVADRNRFIIPVYYLLNVLVFGGYLYFVSRTMQIPDDALLEYALDSAAAIVFLFLTSFSLHAIYIRALDRAESEIRRNKELNGRLERATEEKISFFINLSHEMKTPLTLIHNYLNGYIKRKGCDEDLAVVMENFQRLENDIVNYLDHEKLRKGQAYYDHGRIVNVSALLNGRIPLFRETARQKNLTLECDIQPDLCARMDAYAIDRVVNNLLDNAVRYTNPGGKIRIGLAAEGNAVRYSVSDTGIGIPAGERENIFKPYYQLTHMKRNTQGIGMGLAIVKRIIDEVGGRIELDSVPGEGSTFAVVLSRFTPEDSGPPEETPEPLPDFIPAAHITRTGAEPGSDAGGAYTVMVVEDNVRMRSYLCDSIGERYAVIDASGGRDALEKIASGVRPDLILSDIMMDEMDGHELFAKLMEDERFRAVPFVFLTARTGRDEKIRSLSQGVVDYIPKPFDISEVMARIGSLLTLTRNRRRESVREVENRVLDAIHGRAVSADPSRAIEERSRQFGISDREREILELLLDGKGDKEIGYLLDISYHTVRSHVSKIFRKCGVQNKMELLKVFQGDKPFRGPASPPLLQSR